MALKRGDIGPDVAQWQRSLSKAGYQVQADGSFGPQTDLATREFQRDHWLPVDGVVGPVTLAALSKVGGPEFIRARHYTPRARTAVRLIVLHSTESARVQGAARSVATWFAGSSAPQASSHYVVDAHDTIQCVDEQAVAWTQGAANDDCISIEIVGRASYTREQWLDEYGEPTLRRVAALIHDIAARWNIHIAEVVDPADPSTRGVTTHAAITRSYHVQGGHTDPGPGFPLGLVLDWASGAP